MDEGLQRTGNFLPRADKRANELAIDRQVVAISAPGSVAAEQFRVLYHRLEQARAVRAFRTLAFTSAVSGEGKSLTAANLALVAAAADPTRKVLLVDADLRRPRLNLLLGIDGRPGLADLLSGEATAQEVVRKVPGSALFALPAGAPRQDAGQLIASPAMRTFLARARESFDQVIVDAPPVLPVADGALLAAMSEATVLVVRAGVTSRSLVRQAVEALEGSRLLGSVLNGVEAGEVPYLMRTP